MKIKEYLRKIYATFRFFTLKSLLDGYFVSFPKCGRTWVRYFLGSYFQNKYSIPLEIEFDHIIRSHKNRPRILFTHRGFDLFNEHKLNKDIKSFAGEKVAFLARDPRDIVVSYYHHITKRQSLGGPTDISISEFIRNKQFGIQQIIQFMNLWYSSKYIFDDFLLVKYENLQNKPVEEFSKILNFFGEEDIDHQSLLDSINESSFENMKKAEKANKLDNERLQPGNRNDQDSYKVRKGKSGGFKEELNESDIVYVNKKMEDLNKEFGYTI